MNSEEQRDPVLDRQVRLWSFVGLAVVAICLIAMVLD